MTGSRRSSDVPDDELDPTGVRALLANLPDPGPMPEEVVARISQSLQLEQQRRSGGGARSYPLETSRDGSPHDRAETDSDRHVISLSSERQRRRPGRAILWLGGAAAVALVGTVSVSQFFGESSMDTGVSAQYPAASDSAEEGADAGAAPDSAGAAGDEAADAPAPVVGDGEARGETGSAGALDDDGSLDVDALEARVLTVDGTVLLTDAALTDRLESWVSARHVSGVTDWTPAEAVSCITAHGLGADATTQFLVSDATWDDQPAMLVVKKDSTVTAWVIDRACDDVLSGPVPVG